MNWKSAVPQTKVTRKRCSTQKRIAFFLFRFNNYKLAAAQDQYLADGKAIGLFLRDNYKDLNLYYYSTISTKPSIIFYSERVVNYLPYPSPKPEAAFVLVSELEPDFKKASKVFDTEKIDVYIIN